MRRTRKKKGLGLVEDLNILKHLIQATLRDVARMYWKPREDAKKAAKISPATYECQICNKWVYEGKSDKSYEKLIEDNPDKEIVKQKGHMDHIDPVNPRNPDKPWQETSIYRVFCPRDNWQYTCKKCNKKKGNK